MRSRGPPAPDEDAAGREATLACMSAWYASLADRLRERLPAEAHGDIGWRAREFERSRARGARVRGADSGELG